MTEELDEFPYGEFENENDDQPAEGLGSYPDVPGDDEAEGLGAPGDAPRTGVEAIALARQMSANRTFVGSGMCLKTVRTYYGINAKYLDATDSYNAADHKVHVRSGIDVPRGVPVYWTGGSSGHGHIALSLGGGLCLSTDWKEPGRIDVARIDDITARWGLPFQGYAWEVNDVIAWKPPTPVGVVSLKNLKPGATNHDVLEVKQQLKRKGYGKLMNLKSSKFGPGTRRAYKQFQQKLGFHGSAADGIPGTTSLKKLGFKVK